MTTILLAIAVFGFFALVIGAAIGDLASMIIPNRIPAGLILLFAVAAPAAGLGLELVLWHVGVGLLVFAGTAALFAAGLFGGGDAKLMPAVALWLGPAAVGPFVMATAIAGGLLAVTFLVLRRLPVPALVGERPWMARLMTEGGGIPYGVAIAAGALLSIGNAPVLKILAG
jgi:prepilin peptidase CpaA